MSLETAHLSLIPCVPAHILTLIEQPERFEQVAGFPAAAGLRELFASNEVSPDWLAALRAYHDPDPWRHGFFLVHREARAAIGSVGFKGPPDSTGTVEIAYGVAPSLEGHGYATEAAAALVGFAFRHATGCVGLRPQAAGGQRLDPRAGQVRIPPHRERRRP